MALTIAYRQGVVEYRTVAQWVNRLSSGRKSFEDDSRYDRPITVITQQNTDAVEDLVNDNPHIAYMSDTVATKIIRQASINFFHSLYLRLEKSRVFTNMSTEVSSINILSFSSIDQAVPILLRKKDTHRMIVHLPKLSDNYIKRTISIIKMYNFQLINI